MSKAEGLTYEMAAFIGSADIDQSRLNQAGRRGPAIKESALHRQPLYGLWVSMIQRCSNPNSPKYPLYGGRGIRVCDEWLADYHKFAADVGPRPPGLSIDRIDPDGHYCKENCRWASAKQQSNNRRKIPVTHNRLKRATKPGDPGICGLTPAEELVLHALASGLTNREAAEKLLLSMRTVEIHAQHIMEKINIRGRMQLGMWYAKNFPERCA